MGEWMGKGHILFWRKTTITIGNGQVIPTENGYSPCEIKTSRRTRGENAKNPLGICNGRRHPLWCINNTINFENLFSGSLFRRRLLTGRKTIHPFGVFPVRVRVCKHITNTRFIRDELSLRDHKPDFGLFTLFSKFVILVVRSKISIFLKRVHGRWSVFYCRYHLLTRLGKSTIHQSNITLDNGEQSMKFYTI